MTRPRKAMVGVSLKFSLKQARKYLICPMSTGDRFPGPKLSTSCRSFSCFSGFLMQERKFAFVTKLCHCTTLQLYHHALENHTSMSIKHFPNWHNNIATKLSHSTTIPLHPYANRIPYHYKSMINLEDHTICHHTTSIMPP